MLVGFIFGATSLDSAEPYLQSEVIFTFIELGEILTLFFTGLTVDFDAFSRYLWWVNRKHLLSACPTGFELKALRCHGRPRIIIATFWRSVLLAGLLALIGWSSGV
jgi:Kef-type K+ transport system membrane component KefB